MLRLNIRPIALAAIVLALGGAASWLGTATPIVNLGVGTNLSKSQLQERWTQGDVVVMVRHAERCDRSGNLCLGMNIPSLRFDFYCCNPGLQVLLA